MSARITAVYSALMAALGAAVLAAPESSGPLWTVMGALTVGAILYGVRVHAPHRRVPWWLLAGAVAAMSLGDALYTHGPDTAALADVFYFAMFPLVATGLLLMTRSSTVLADRARMLDVLTFACAAGLAGYVLLFGPSVGAGALGGLDRAMLAAYALGDLLVLLAAARLAVAAPRCWAAILLAGGAAALLAADVWFAHTLLEGGGWTPGSLADVGYVLLYAGWGLAALHPSMRVLTEPVDPWPTRLPARRAVLLAVSLAVPAALLLTQAATGRVHDVGAIALGWLLMLVLTLTRLTDAVGHYRRAVVRERALRQAAGALVVAANPDHVRLAARSAVGDLLARGLPYEVLLVDADRLPAGGRRTRLVEAAALGPELRDRVAGCDAALLFPLSPGATGVAPAALLVAGPRRALVTTRNAIEVLAAQAALALERIELTEAMNRRDSDEYLRAVVRNATDVVLVLDDDERIRYASPSLTTVLGARTAVRHTLHDLADPRDRHQISRTLADARRSPEPDGVRDVWTLRRPDGSRVTVDVTYRDLRADRMVRGFVVTMHDVTDRHEAEEQLRRQALQASPGGKNRRSSARKFD